MPFLELREISKSFGAEQALSNINIACGRGEFFCLLGPSGAGKSTTINIISGIVRPDEGEVILDDVVITDSFPQERNIATAFENYALYPHFTVFKNMEFPLKAPVRSANYSDAERAARVREIAEMLGISELLERYPKELSGGQRQRVALGRTLVRKPKIYLLDEPIAHLDAKLRHSMRGELKKIQMDLGVTTIYSTPDQLEALSMADTIAVLNKGKIEQIGNRREIYESPANLFVAQFVGDPPMNILDVSLNGTAITGAHDGSFRLSISKEDHQRLSAGAGSRQLKLGFRPKDTKLVSVDNSEAHVKGRVKTVDTLGRSSDVTVKIGAVDVKAKVVSDEKPEIGANVGLQLDDSRLYFFDAESTQRIV